jgi:SRSO17 transposase
MLPGLKRKTDWSLAGHAGEVPRTGCSGWFTTARWDQDAVRDDARGYVVSAPGDPDGVLIGDDTGFEKKGACSADVQRQYTGTAGKITNCQLGSSWPTRRRRAARSSTGSFTCPGPGRETRAAWQPRR